MRRWLFLALPLAGCAQDVTLTKETASLSVTPVLTDLGAVALGTTSTVTLTLAAESGDVSIFTIDMLNVEGGTFSLAEDPPETVPSGETREVALAFTPDAEGYNWARVTVYGDDVENAHEVTVRAEAVAADVRVYPEVLDFGPVQTGTTAEGELVLANDGRVDVTLATLDLGDPRFSTSLTFPAEVAAGTSLTVPVTYTALDEQEATADATFDLGGAASLSPVTLRANACSTASGELYDSDGDGFSFCGDDCDDFAAGAYPGAEETCDGTDEDCDGDVDEGTPCVDDDGDGYSEDDGDCNDAADGVSPGTAEVQGNGVDDDCDGVTDDGSVDVDGDGWGAYAGDCDDADASVYPGAPELEDGDDDDCDGVADDGTSAYDDDGDGFSEDAGDCDDASATVYPHAAERANWVDDDCDGSVDEGTDYGDDDGDGFTETGGDCDDADASVNPGEPEVTGNRKDDDCDGVTE